jgi:hypothetical protein
MGRGLVGGSQVIGEGAPARDSGTLAPSSLSFLPSDHEGKVSSAMYSCHVLCWHRSALEAETGGSEF